MRILAILDRLSDIAAFAGACAILPLVGVMVWEVFSRYVFAAPTSWVFEVSYMLMGFIFMMGTAYALKHRQHVSVDLIYGSRGPRYRALVDITCYVLLLPLVCWLAYALAQYGIRAYVSGEVTGKSAWNPPVWPFRVILSVGFVFFAIQIAVEFLGALLTLLGRARQMDR